MERRDQIPTGYVRRGADGEATPPAGPEVGRTPARRDFDWSEDDAAHRAGGDAARQDALSGRELGVLGYVGDAEARLFVGAKAEYYITAWKLLKLRSLPLGWNWSAFLLGPVWLAYRRMALFAVLWIVLWFVGASIPFSFPLWWLGMHLATGAAGNTLYHAHAVGIARSSVARADNETDRKAMLMTRGGTGLLGPAVVLLLGAILAVLVVAFVMLYLLAREAFDHAMTFLQAQAPFLQEIAQRIEDALGKLGQ